MISHSEELAKSALQQSSVALLSPKAGKRISQGSNGSPQTSPKIRTVPPPPAHASPGSASASQQALQSSLISVEAPTRSPQSGPPPVPDASYKPQNPFRGAAHTSHGVTHPVIEQSPNPFKQAKPKIVRPTPIVADASTPIFGRPSPGPVDPFKTGGSGSSRGGGSPVSGRSIIDASAGDLKPPPLPPRHISPLIQAGLNARSEVRRKQEARPPKTFTVLQSTSARHAKERPRLLTGQAAPPAVPAKKRSDTRASSSSVIGHREGPLPAPIAPKPSYGAKGKTGIPAWLREQEELHKSSLLDHHNEPNAAPRDSFSRGPERGRSKMRTTSEATRIQFLDNDSESGSDEETLSEQARSAASIDRNNPFFRHGRDQERSVDLKETLSKLAVENAVTKAERESKLNSRAISEASTERRLLGRSKTMRETSRGMTPPAVPPRKRNDAFPAPLYSGTYAGFGKSVRVEGPTAGGLRQTPVSRKAEVGIPAHVLAERERHEREKHDRSLSGPQDIVARPLPPPRRRSSSSQVSASDTTTLKSPNEEPGPPAYVPEEGGESVRDMLKQDFESFAQRHSWLPHAAEKATGRPISEAHVGLMDDLNDKQRHADSGDDEPEVDEHYLVEKRKELQRHWQRGGSIDTFPHDFTPNGTRRASSGATHTSPQQKRAMDTGRRSLSGNGHVRRSSLLSRGGFVAEDVIRDESSQGSDSERTPKEKSQQEVERPFVDASEQLPKADLLVAPDVDKGSADKDHSTFSIEDSSPDIRSDEQQQLI